MARGGKSYPRNRFRQPYNGANNIQMGAHVPTQLVLLGRFSHACMEEAICQVQIEQVPYFNAFIYAANRQPIGKVDDIFGKMHEFSVSIRLNEPKLVKTFKQSDEFFIEQQKLLPLMRFLSKPKTIVNVSAKAKPKLRAHNKCTNPDRSFGGKIGRAGRASAGSAYSRGRGGRNFVYKRQYSNNMK